jgi:hypothetical protein
LVAVVEKLAVVGSITSVSGCWNTRLYSVALSTYTVVKMATVVRGATAGVAAVVGCASDYYQVVDSWLSFW